MSSISDLYAIAIANVKIFVENLASKNYRESGEIKCRTRIEMPKNCSAKTISVTLIYGKPFDGILANMHQVPMRLIPKSDMEPIATIGKTNSSSTWKLWSCSTPKPCYGDFSFYFMVHYEVGYRQLGTMPIQFRSPDQGYYKSTISPRPAQGIGCPILNGLPTEGNIITVLGVNESGRYEMVLTNNGVSDLVIESITAEDGSMPNPNMPPGAFSADSFLLQGLPAFPVTLQCLGSLSFTILYIDTMGSTALLVIKTSVLTYKVEMYGKVFII